MKYGTLEERADGRWQLRFTRTLGHPVESVWRAITEPEHLAQWFPSTIEGELKAGSRLLFAFPGQVAEPIAGEMLAYDPPTRMELRWGTDQLTFHLRPVAEGTELTLIDVLDERGKGARDGAGWHTCLDALEAALAGDEQSRAKLSSWDGVHSDYVKRFGPEAATIGPG